MDEEKGIFEKFSKQSTSAPIVVLIEFTAIILVTQGYNPIRVTDYLFLILKFIICTAILLIAWIALTVIVNTILKKIKNLSEQALQIIWYIIPIVILLIYAFWRMIENG